VLTRTIPGLILTEMTQTQEKPLVESQPSLFLKLILAPIIPYITVGIGLLVLHNVWIAMLGYHAGMVIILLLSGSKFDFKLILKSTNKRITLIAVGFGAAGGILMYILWPLLAVPADIGIYLKTVGLTTFSWPFFLAYFILINPWIEEYYWRGFLGSNLKRPVVNDMFFAGYHILVLMGKIEVLWLVICFVCLIAGAWFWRQSDRWSQGLLSSTTSHIAADCTIMFAIFMMTAGSN
jgi:hypothetical protein